MGLATGLTLMAIYWLGSTVGMNSSSEKFIRLVFFGLFLIGAALNWITLLWRRKTNPKPVFTFATTGIFIPSISTALLVQSASLPTSLFISLFIILAAYILLEDRELDWTVPLAIAAWILVNLLANANLFSKIIAPTYIIFSHIGWIFLVFLLGYLPWKTLVFQWSLRKKWYLLIFILLIIPASLAALNVREGMFSDQPRLSQIILVSICPICALGGIWISRRILKPLLDLRNECVEIIGENSTSKTWRKFDVETSIIFSALHHLSKKMDDTAKESETSIRALAAEHDKEKKLIAARLEQYQIISDVVRAISATQDIEAFLDNVTQLVSSKFNFYHVGIFLLNESGDYAVLRASNSEGGKRMLARQHRLPVGHLGIVGHVTGTGQPRIALDVGNDPIYFNNPDLPLTRSEMALPLQYGGTIIGAMDIQSTLPDAFSQDDILLFSILADQVAIAIMNNRLYEETANALEETQNVYRQYLRQEWSKTITDQAAGGYRYTDFGISQQPESDADPHVHEAVKSGEIVTISSPGQPSCAVVPIILRGETIGVIKLQENHEQREFTESELESVRTIADQIALALENARLFEQTVRRAERERKVLEVTSKIRSTNDPQTMLQIALQELQTALHTSRAQIILLDTQTNNNNQSSQNL